MGCFHSNLVFQGDINIKVISCSDQEINFMVNIKSQIQLENIYLNFYLVGIETIASKNKKLVYLYKLSTKKIDNLYINQENNFILQEEFNIPQEFYSNFIHFENIYASNIFFIETFLTKENADLNYRNYEIRQQDLVINGSRKISVIKFNKRNIDYNQIYQQYTTKFDNYQTKWEIRISQQTYRINQNINISMKIDNRNNSHNIISGNAELQMQFVDKNYEKHLENKSIVYFKQSNIRGSKQGRYEGILNNNTCQGVIQEYLFLYGSQLLVRAFHQNKFKMEQWCYRQLYSKIDDCLMTSIYEINFIITDNYLIRQISTRMSYDCIQPRKRSAYSNQYQNRKTRKSQSPNETDQTKKSKPFQSPNFRNPDSELNKYLDTLLQNKNMKRGHFSNEKTLYQELTQKLWDEDIENKQDQDNILQQPQNLKTKKTFDYLGENRCTPILTERCKNLDDSSFHQKSVDQYKSENQQLKRQLIQMKLDMYRKSKLEENLINQKQELKMIMKEYIEFIDKILIDKKELKQQLEQMNMKYEKLEEEYQCLMKQYGQKKYDQFEVKSLRYQNNSCIQKQQKEYSESAILLIREENMKLKETVSVLQEENYVIKKEQDEIDEKIVYLQQLVNELEQEKQQAFETIEAIKEDNHNMKQHYEQQIREAEENNFIEFQKFEQIVQEALKKKDGNIKKLKSVIDTLKNQSSLYQ